MKKFVSAATMMMKMCMWNCCMYMIFRVHISDTLSILKAKHITA